MPALSYIGECILNNIEAINRNMFKWHHTQNTQHRHVVRFNCLTVWSNSKWMCDLSIDSFPPRLWIKCFNYWCTDVTCPLECCMWCRPLSPGKLLPPPRSQPNSPSTPTITTTTTTTPPPADTLMLPLAEQALYLAWMESKHVADRRQPIGRCWIHQLSLFVYICHPSPPSTAILPTKSLSVPCLRSAAAL